MENPDFGFHAQAKDSTLERPSLCSELHSSDGMFLRVQTHARTTRPALERGTVSYARASIERTATRESTLKRPLCFGRLARAGKATLERDPCFQQILKSVARHRTKARSVKLSSRFVQPTIVPHFEVPSLPKPRLFLGCLRFTLLSMLRIECLRLGYTAFGNHGLLVGYDAKPLWANLGRDT
ncbi:hypothetical protein CsSME_00050913 [Camellia sinensis var. sinensis]